MKKNIIWFFMALLFLGSSAYLFFQTDEEFAGVCRAEIQKFDVLKKKTKFLPLNDFPEPQSKATQYSSGVLAGQALHWAFQVNSTGFGALHCDGRFMDKKNKPLARLFIVASPSSQSVQSWPELTELDQLFKPCSDRKLNNSDRARVEVMKSVNEVLQSEEGQNVYWGSQQIIKAREIPLTAQLKLYEYSLWMKASQGSLLLEYRIQSPLKETSLQNIELQRRLSKEVGAPSNDALAQCLVDLQAKVDGL
ncbi:MAG: hypothetical protein ACK5P6_04605 [Pseudobdellovibrionaceae bacterium]